MKTRIFNILVILITVLLLTAAVPDSEFSISLGEEFTCAKPGDNLDAVSQKLSMSTGELSSYFTENGLLYLAVTDNAKTQIKISTYCDNFSSETSDIAYLNDQMLKSFVEAVCKKSNSDATIVLNGDRKFVCVKELHEDSGGVYTVTQYVTICNNKTYYFIGYNDGQDTSAQIKSAFESFKIINQQETAIDYTPQMILIMAGIVVFSIIAIIMIVGIVKHTQKSAEGEEANDEIE